QPLDRRESAWHREARNIKFSVKHQQQAWAAYDELQQRLQSDPPASDPAADALSSKDRWRPVVDALSSFINGTELDHLSVADFMAYERASSENNWRLPGGYGAFIAGLGADLPKVLETTVRSV